MFRSKIKTRYRRNNNARFYQGDILKDLSFVVGDSGITKEKDIIYLPYAVILSQDCDMQHDFNCRKDSKNQDKFLLSLLVCPSFNLEDFANGNHFPGWKMETFSAKLISRIKNNDIYRRYHFLPATVELKYSIPDLVLDFKHFFTLPRDFLYKQRREIYVASVNEIFREELSQRFSNYLSRIGLPELDK